jgi:hypothetical protein
MRAEHGNPDRVRAALVAVGRPTVRRAEFSGGNRMSKKRMPVGESRQETSTTLNGSSRPSLLDNWPDTGPGARASKEALTWTGEPVKRSGP